MTGALSHIGSKPAYFFDEKSSISGYRNWDLREKHTQRHQLTDIQIGGMKLYKL